MLFFCGYFTTFVSPFSPGKTHIHMFLMLFLDRNQYNDFYRSHQTKATT